MKNIIKGEIISQNGIYLVPVNNSRTEAYAYIVNQEDVEKDLYGKTYEFEIVGIIRPSKGYLNTHIIRGGDMFNLIGTNGQLSLLKDLLKADYIPSLVRLITTDYKKTKE